jgi:hypothetical protein
VEIGEQFETDGPGDVLGCETAGDAVLAQGPRLAEEFTGGAPQTPARAVSSALVGAASPPSQASTRSGVT